jgi:hypothetical protein
LSWLGHSASKDLSSDFSSDNLLGHDIDSWLLIFHGGNIGDGIWQKFGI